MSDKMRADFFELALGILMKRQGVTEVRFTEAESDAMENTAAFEMRAYGDDDTPTAALSVVLHGRQ